MKSTYDFTHVEETYRAGKAAYAEAEAVGRLVVCDLDVRMPDRVAAHRSLILEHRNLR